MPFALMKSNNVGLQLEDVDRLFAGDHDQVTGELFAAKDVVGHSELSTNEYA